MPLCHVCISNGPFEFMALGPLIPSRAGGFRATDVILLGAPTWSSDPSCVGSLYLRGGGIYIASPFTAACYYSPCSSSSAAGMFPRTALLPSQGRTVPFSLSKSSSHD